MDKSCNVLPRRPSATDLILDLLVARGMPLPASDIARAAALFDIGENAVRVCLSRLVSSEKIERTARGLGAAHQHWLDMVINSQERLDDLPLASAVRETLLLGRSAIAHLLRDPLLPEELMPSGTRHALRAHLRAYQQKALELWLTWLSQHD